MPALDIDPEILRITAEASAHAYAQSIWHIEEEINASNGNMEPLYDTLTPEGPYAYMVMPELLPDGGVKLPRLTLREEIVEAYGMIRGHSDLTEVIGLTEIRGTWYTFQDNISTSPHQDGPRSGVLHPDPRALPLRKRAGHHGRADLDPLPGRIARRSRRAQHHPRRPARSPGNACTTATRRSSRRCGPTTSTPS